MKKWLHICFLLIFISCSSGSDQQEEYIPIPVSLEVPILFQQKLIAPLIPADNPLTEEGIALGKKLFFDTILSKDNTQSCATCHNPENSFTDTDQFSDGIDGIRGTRNSMPLFNLVWNFDERFTWDGKEFSLEKQAFEPVSNPIEMHSNWIDVEKKLQNHPEYPSLFQLAFKTVAIDSALVVKAIAQFERTLISANSKFDKYLLGQVELTDNELNGFNVFMDETKGDCFHCHGSNNNPLWTDNKFHNNGLDATFTDLGLGGVTGDTNDNGKFRSPSLRNLAFTAPYMHDGRFLTIDEVINHYSEGLQNSETIDPLMKKIDQGGVNLTSQDKADLKAFLLSLSDYDFINNPKFQQ
ncbi:cytochrome c peroxidase [Tenacibaculum adriaticum]|uniref:Cytochrome c peroxidase n=1 Tax=Tenacibaculum adriaticum TaxID=413713 RepID=A0A5S5DZ38_9FLAO|nr:cytochrome c peroxidase [Tenacibaculum adriaticum]TYQ00013.1 cytochrome c peroxidase [Tenacibaculum adriaticum]